MLASFSLPLDDVALSFLVLFTLVQPFAAGVLFTGCNVRDSSGLDLEFDGAASGPS